MRIPKKSCVEHHVRLARQTRGKSEGHEGNRQARVAAVLGHASPESLLDPAPQLGQRQFGGVQHEIRFVAQRPGQDLLLMHAVNDAPLRRHGVTAPRLGVPAEQGPLIRPRINEFGADARRGLEPHNGPAHHVRVEAAAARVQPDRDRLVGPADKGLEQRNRRVVDRVVPDVLERPEDRGLASAGQPTDDHDAFDRHANAPASCSARPHAQSSARRTRAGAEASAGSTLTRGRPS